MVHVVHLVSIGVDASHAVQNQSVALPAVPQFVDQLHKLVGAVVALIVIQVALEPKVECLAVVHQVTTFQAARPPER